MVTARVTLAALLALHAVGCDDGGAPAAEQVAQPAADSPGDVAFAPALGVVLDSMMETSSGVYVQDLQTGRGTAATAGKSVTVEYRAWLPDGTLYDERPNAQGWGPAEFPLAEGAPVPGLVHGIDGMRVGGVRRIVVPPEHGYGLVGRPAGVPAGATLVFQVRLIGVREEL